MKKNNDGQSVQESEGERCNLREWCNDVCVSQLPEMIRLLVLLDERYHHRCAIHRPFTINC